jgi:hypothetical protein
MLYNLNNNLNVIKLYFYIYFLQGPNYMSTEYFTRYEGKQRPNIPDKNHSSIGPKELSGFVENKLYEDAITAVPGERWLNRDRSIGNTVYKDKFLPYSFAKVGNFYYFYNIRYVSEFFVFLE